MGSERIKAKPEICSPAGSFDSLSAALRSGADSVYFGVGSLNMRSRSSVNFRIDDIPRLAEKCRRLGVKSYLALNTLIYDTELDEMKRICDAASAAGISAVIASDISVMDYARSTGLPVHVSVQANVANIEAVKFYSRFAEAVVLARELELDRIRKIIDAIHHHNITGPSGEPVRIEIFAHGALCVSVSGKCYMSLAVYNKSGNRGECYQNCRRAYRVIDEETGEELVIDGRYVMSPKDICTVSVLDRLVDAGVSIFKIEGRGRSPDYVGKVTRVYREALDSCLDGTFGPEKVSRWIPELESVFNRGFWQGGYYLGEKLGEWCDAGGNVSLKKKKHIGRVSGYFPKIGVAELSLDADGFKKGQELLVCGSTTGALEFTPVELRLDREPVEKAAKGDVVSVPVPRKVRRNDKVYLLMPRRFGEK